MDSLNDSRMTMMGRGTLANKQQAAIDKNFRIHYEKFRTLEDDEIAQVQHIFKNLSGGVANYSKSQMKVKSQYLGEILQLLQHNVGLEEVKELTVQIDKTNMGRFSMDKLISMLGNVSFQEQTQEDLLKSFQELDDDADGYISKREMERILKTMGEGLSDEELQYFFEKAVDPNSANPDMISIQKITEILLPKMEATNLLATRGNNNSNQSLAEGADAQDAAAVVQAPEEQ